MKKNITDHLETNRILFKSLKLLLWSFEHLVLSFQNPQFNKSSTYVIFAHLLRQVSSLTDGEHQYLVHWLRR